MAACLSVGRSDWAQLVCTYDERVSRVHFKVRTDEFGCYLVDHASRNGTFVNGMRVTDCMLRTGDKINAGVTDFVVDIEGDSPEQARTLHGTSWENGRAEPSIFARPYRRSGTGPRLRLASRWGLRNHMDIRELR